MYKGCNRKTISEMFLKEAIDSSIKTLYFIIGFIGLITENHVFMIFVSYRHTLYWKIMQFNGTKNLVQVSAALLGNIFLLYTCKCKVT